MLLGRSSLPGFWRYWEMKMLLILWESSMYMDIDCGRCNTNLKMHSATCYKTVSTIHLQLEYNCRLCYDFRRLLSWSFIVIHIRDVWRRSFNARTREDVDASETQSFTRVAFSNCLKDDTDVEKEEAVCTRFGLKVLGKESSLSVLCTSYPERVQTCQPKKIVVKTTGNF